MSKLKIFSGSVNWIDDDILAWEKENPDYSVVSYKFKNINDKVVLVLEYNSKNGIEL